METVVIQSAKAAAELFKNHDVNFCDRKCIHVLTSHNYRDGSLAVGQFSPYWRMLRRLCSVEMMTNRRIDETTSIRRKCIDQMIRSIEDDVVAATARGESIVINLPKYLFLMAFNIVGNLMLSRDVLDSQTGSETTSAIIEWAMAELLRKPEVMKRVKEELHEVVGVNRLVEESDIEKLPYLQALFKETLRRDPDSWEDPLAFKPDRFLDSNIDYKGQNFELIPFGSGRRICVGMLLVQRVVLLGLASLINCFDWELDKDSTPETLDMKERIGVTVRKLVPLNVIPKRHPRIMAT
ncbi:hypothetical protein GH714_006730 [Hevea brasiliensis]|uniref:Cytochrome P450 n=1 Tax=Hevea brasiliensis TaxID=3981 RepID=A0A6A6L0Y9_HEVBR|nr:hypothetical protein GH714_006730 [Hevea brasiliensis]